MNWAVVEVVTRGVDRLTSSHTHRVPGPDIEHISCNEKLFHKNYRGSFNLEDFEKNVKKEVFQITISDVSIEVEFFFISHLSGSGIVTVIGLWNFLLLGSTVTTGDTSPPCWRRSCM